MWTHFSSFFELPVNELHDHYRARFDEYQMDQIATKKKIYFSDTRSRKTLRNKNLSGKLLTFRHDIQEVVPV